MRAVRVKSIKDTGCTEAVYSIRVDSECHSYVSNGIISHNTEAKVNPETLDIFFKHNQLGVVYEKNYDNTLDIAEHFSSTYTYVTCEWYSRNSCRICNRFSYT